MQGTNEKPYEIKSSDEHIVYNNHIEFIAPKQSANTLFRFFSNFDYMLRAIEKGAFIPRYCVENIDYLELPIYKIAYPMVCFCDITIHRLSEHMNTYGSYGLGFAKTWGINNGIQPIQYINTESPLCKDFKVAFETALKEQGDNQINNYLSTHMYYIKPIEGSMSRNDKIIKKNFTDECEWRYIPNILQTELPQAIIDDGTSFCQLFNHALERDQNVWLRFKRSDIKYIVVESKKDFNILVDFLNGISASESEKMELISKLIIWENAKEDF